MDPFRLFRLGVMCGDRVLLVRHQKPSDKSRTSNIMAKTYWFQPISPPLSGTLHHFTLGTPPKLSVPSKNIYNMRSLNLKKTNKPQETRWTRHKTQQLLMSLISFCIFCFFPATCFCLFPSTSATVFVPRTPKGECGDCQVKSSVELMVLARLDLDPLESTHVSTTNIICHS